MNQSVDHTTALQRAQRAYHDGRMGVVESECRRILETAPDNAEAWVLMATVARHYARLDDAAEMMRRAVHLRPENRHMKEVLAGIYLAQRDWRNAEALYAGLLKESPDTRFLNALAKCAWGTGRYEQALARFREAAEQAPRDGAAQVGLAQGLLSLWRFDEAERVLTRFLEAVPTHAGAWMLLSRIRLDDADPGTAATLARRAAGCEDANALVHLTHAALERLNGRAGAAEDSRRLVPAGARFESMWEGFEYSLAHRPPARLFGLSDQVLAHAARKADGRGLNLEFGVFHGRSIANLAGVMKGGLHGFDSFQGLPEDWSPGEPAGSYSTNGIRPEVPSGVELHAGWFEDTLPAFLADHRQAVRFAHIDCDLYSSTRTVLEQLRPRLREGTILVFDDYLGYPGWRDHEYRAFQEFIAESGFSYRYLAFGLLDRSAAVEITQV